MQKNKYKFEIKLPTGNLLGITQGWFILAVSSLAVAGIFSLPEVILRGSIFKKMWNVEEIFATALVLHVNLSVLVWMLAMICMLFSLFNRKEYELFSRTALILAALGAICMALSPLFGESNPLKNNYIPMLQNLSFILGLAFFSCGVIFQVFLMLLTFQPAKSDAAAFGIYSIAIIIWTAALCFVLSGMEIRDALAVLIPEQYYETLFWAGGHILQFAYVQGMIVAWVMIAALLGGGLYINTRILTAIFIITLIAVIPTPLIYIYEITDYRFMNFFTAQMKHAGGIPALLIALPVLAGLFTVRINKEQRPQRNALFLSIIVFATGGVLGFLISGTNVTIPAHYHGSIVGVTLAFMALAYEFLPRLKLGKIRGWLASAQPILYGGGQLMHIIGLSLMGGYGALRKAPGTSDSTNTLLGKTLFFSGGSLAIIGGLLFIILIFRAIIKNKN